MVSMAELNAVFVSLGFGNVKTYINSGNVAFDVESQQKPARGEGTGVSSPHGSKGSINSETLLVDDIEQAIEKKFGLNILVMVREQKAIEKILKSNPFDGEFESHKEMHVLFMKDEMPLEKQVQLMEKQTGDERFAVIGREIYCHLRLGVADSLLGKGYIEKKLKVPTTGRNWRTVQKLAEL